MWSFLRAIDEDEPRPRLWSLLFAASLGVSLLWKSLIGVVFPLAACLIYLAVTRQLTQARKSGGAFTPSADSLIVTLAIAAPWHVLATLRNPPYFDLTFHSAPGEYHGFLWFFFMNEQVLRFLNMRYPRDYDTVPRLWFWLFHLLWLFPWSVYLPAAHSKSRSGLKTGQGRCACLRSPGPVSFWCSSRSPPRRNIIQCLVIRRSRCSSAIPWIAAARGSIGARACSL